MRAKLGEQCVIKANAQFWEQMLAMTLDPVPAAGDIQLAAGHMLGSVSLSGVWKGRIEVRLTGRLAHEATATMLMIPVDTVGDAETLDATREIANMIAGVIKSCLPRPCAMTVPEAALEDTACSIEPHAIDTVVVAFRHAAGDFIVRVWEQECLV